MFGDYSYKMLVKALRVDEIAIGESVWGGGGERVKDSRRQREEKEL